eukprot:jgi/Galph1/98/GphlegSOOS_G4820.1
MFYSTEILTKKGPLGKVWLAATVGKDRIQKKFALDVSVASLCNEVMRPPTPYALRLSAQLMLGICRIFEKKCSIVFVTANDIVYHLEQIEGTTRRLAEESFKLRKHINLKNDTACKENITLSTRTTAYPPEIGSLLQNVENHIQFLGYEQLLQQLTTSRGSEAILFENELLDMAMGSSLASQISEDKQIYQELIQQAIRSSSSSSLQQIETFDTQRLRSLSFPQADPNDITLRDEDINASLELSEASYISLSCFVNEDLHEQINMSTWSPREDLTTQQFVDTACTVQLDSNLNSRQTSRILNGNSPLEGPRSFIKNVPSTGKLRTGGNSIFRRDVKTELTAKFLKSCLNNPRDTIIQLPLWRQVEISTDTDVVWSILVDPAHRELQLPPPPNLPMSFDFQTPPRTGKFLATESLRFTDDVNDPEMLRRDRLSSSKRRKISVSTVETSGIETRSRQSALSLEGNLFENLVTSASSSPTKRNVDVFEEEDVMDFGAIPHIDIEGRDSIGGSSTLDTLTSAALDILEKEYFSVSKQVTFSEISKGSTRSSAAKIFYYILVLKTHNRLQVEQSAPFGTIVIRSH